jgi:hypothetical protein
MTNPIAREIRKLREKWADEYWKDPQKFYEKRDRERAVRAASVTNTAPLTSAASTRRPAAKKKENRKR